MNLTLVVTSMFVFVFPSYVSAKQRDQVEQTAMPTCVPKMIQV
jgi:hypothetical protein